jgi:uroporphyrinogen III methyltransferase/synthase
LAELGWEVDAVEAYRTVRRDIDPLVLVAAGRADAICFASPSAVNSYLDQAGNAGPGTPPLVACIGPVTAAAARSRGLEVGAEAPEHTVEGLLDALVRALAARPD